MVFHIIKYSTDNVQLIMILHSTNIDIIIYFTQTLYTINLVLNHIC